MTTPKDAFGNPIIRLNRTTAEYKAFKARADTAFAKIRVKLTQDTYIEPYKEQNNINIIKIGIIGAILYLGYKLIK